jgi:hypothetical protein
MTTAALFWLARRIALIIVLKDPNIESYGEKLTARVLLASVAALLDNL